MRIRARSSMAYEVEFWEDPDEIELHPRTALHVAVSRNDVGRVNGLLDGRCTSADGALRAAATHDAFRC